MRITLALTLAACGSASGAPQLDTSCTTSCCLPHPEWFGDGVPAQADLVKARATIISSRDSAALALAVHVIANRPEVGDRAVLAKLVDDSRAGGTLPAITITQAVQRCYPVRWQPTTVGREALAALSRLHATPFADAAAYRSWATTHPDPEATFDHWYAVLGTQRPPDAGVLARLERRDPILQVRVLSAYCEDDCPDLGVRLARTLGGDRAVRWLASSERMAEWQRPEIRDRVVRSLLRHGDRVFGEPQYAALAAVYAQKQLSDDQRAALAVILGHLHPREAAALWRAALQELRSGTDVVLREMAKRDPRAFREELIAARGHLTAILEGLAEADATGTPLFHQLAPRVALDDTLPAFAAAARRHGCAGVPDPNTLRIRGAKHASQAARVTEERRARTARELAVARIRGC
ncbi:MAG: hypothetical protein ABI867_08790 [Kofleriaceae bacterium]